jgi:hypothetical protein
MKRSLIDGRRVDLHRGFVILPPDPTILNVDPPDEADLVTPTETQLYPLGAQVKLNGKLYRYSKAGETIAIGHQGFLKCNKNKCPGSTGGAGYEGALYSNAAAGATAIYIADTAGASARPANYYQGGEIWVMNDTLGVYAHYTITKSDVGTASYVVIYIASPGLKYAHTTTSGTVGVYRSPYSNVGSLLTSGNQSWLSAIGMAPMPITTAYYFWLQTAGPCFGTGASTWPGQTAYRRTIYANTDGSLIGGDATTIYYQPVGYLLSGTQSDYGDVFFFMQLDN